MKKLTILAFILSVIIIYHGSVAFCETNKIAIVIAECLDGVEKETMSSCENAIEKELTDVKYHVVHNKFITSFDDTKAFDELIGSVESKSNESVSEEANNEIHPSIQKIIKNTGADILIIGGANAALLSEEPIQETKWANIYSARASGLFKVIDVKTGKVLFTVNEMQSGADVSTATAYEKALSNLGLQAGRKIVEKMMIEE